MEDDFEFTTTPEILKKNFDEFFKTVPYDIIMFHTISIEVKDLTKYVVEYLMHKLRQDT